MDPLPVTAGDDGGGVYLKKVSASFNHSAGTVFILAVASSRDTPTPSFLPRATMFPNFAWAPSFAAFRPTWDPRLRSKRVGAPPGWTTPATAERYYIPVSF